MVSREDGRRDAQRSLDDLSGAAPGLARGRLSGVQPDGRMHYRHGRANRAVVGEAAGDWATRRLLVVRHPLETARPAAQSADPGQGRPGESFAA